MSKYEYIMLTMLLTSSHEFNELGIDREFFQEFMEMPEAAY